MDIVALHAEAKPDATALVCDDVRMTWADLDAAKNRFGHSLARGGAAHGDRVVTYLHNGPERFIAHTACEQLGLTVVPMNYRLTAPEVGYIVNDCGAEIVVYGAEFRDVVADLRDTTPTVTRWICVGGARCAGEDADDFAELSETGDAAAPEPLGKGAGSIIYTSGTTGKPKGAYRKPRVGAGRALMKLLEYLAGEFDMRADDAHLVAGPLYHSAPGAWARWAMALGKTLVVARHYDPVDAVRLIDTYRVGDTFMAPLLVKRLMSVPDEVWEEADVSSLHSIVMAGAPCPQVVKEAVHARLGPVLYEFYGSTELSVSTILKPEDQLRKPGSCGRAFPGADLEILDADGNAVPDGDPGELHVKRSPMTISEYYGKPGALESGAHGDWISVGDVAYRDADGYYYICDRKTDMIITGGVNVYPAEIESTLHAHPAIADVAVFGIPDDEWGESAHAVIELQPDASLTETELHAWCADRLAGFKQPRSLEFVDALPRDAAGKLIKRSLREAHWAGRDRKI